MEFSSPYSAAYEGRMYYFHDRECLERFQERPQAYGTVDPQTLEAR